MQSQAPGKARGKRSAWLILTPILVIGLYYATMYGVRRYVDSRVAAVGGMQLPDFDLVDRAGKRWTADGLRGKTVVLNFFRSRCHNCWEEREEVRQLAKDLDPERTVLLGIMMDEVQGYPAKVTEATLVRYGYEHPILMADQAFVDSFHGAGWAHVTPVTYVADRSGKVTGTFRYPYSPSDLQAAIDG